MESSFQVSICECPDIVASTMAVDVSGRFAVLSGRKTMALVDLEGEDIGSDSIPATTDKSSNDNAKSVDASKRLSSSKPVPTFKKMSRNSKYEPTSSHFNHHVIDLLALTNHQVAEIFSIANLNPLKPKMILRGHSRAIADVEWSHFDPYMLGTSAADCLTNLWDVRDSRRPSASLTSVSAATQIRFSKLSSNLVATSHEIDVRIWDIRQPNLPLNYIAAHLQKINGMDWNPSKTSCDQEQLITCSQDNTIKLWDLNLNKIKPSANLPTRTPPWRIRYTPVSPNAIVTSTWPQLRSRTECSSLKLWSMKPNRYERKKLELILNLVGHTDVIVDFDWRAKPSSGGCEIVSWSKDQTLRVWRIDSQFIEMNVENSDFEAECDVGLDVNSKSSDLLNLFTSTTSSSINESPSKASPDRKTPISSDTTSTTIATTAETSANRIDTPVRSTPSISPAKEATKVELATEEADVDKGGESDLNDASNSTSKSELKQEFSLINKNIPNLEFEELNSLRRVCLVTARAKSISCRLKIALPPAYPHECPTFNIIDSNVYGSESLNDEAKEKLLHLLNETAKAQLSRTRNCLEPCLRKFVAALQKLTSHSAFKKRARPGTQEYKDDPITLSAQRDHSIPFPPTSGARFCGNLLVCFGRPLIPTVATSESPDGAPSANWLVETPRSMAQLSAQLDNMRRQGYYNLSNISISYFYYGAARRAASQSRGEKHQFSGASGGGSGRSSSKYLGGRAKLSSLHSQSLISKNYKCGPVLIYDVSHLLGDICRELAENYVFDKDVIKMCRRNAEIAAAHNRKDLVQIWSLAELSSEGVLHSYIPNKNDDHAFSLVNPDSDFGDRPWTMHPFGSKLIQSLIDHYVYNCHDVQTAAMLVWTFSAPRLGRSMRNQSLKYSLIINNNSHNKGTVSNQLTGTQANDNKSNNSDAASDEWNFVHMPETHLYSNSWSNSTIHEHLTDSQSSHLLDTNIGCRNQQQSLLNSASAGLVANIEERFPKLNILSPERSLQNDLIMHIYAEVLYRLNLLNQRAMVLKNIGSNSAYLELFCDRQSSTQETPDDRLTNLTVQCHNINCKKTCRSTQCSSCKKYSLYCSICRLPVRGSCSVCLKCLHGGHVNHFNDWFQSYDFCPTGCGCKCLMQEL